MQSDSGYRSISSTLHMNFINGNLPIDINFYGGNVNKSTAYIINSQIQNNNPVLTDMNVNKGRCLRCFQL